ncbi:MAG: hypothetical protein VKL42_04450 [Snowella sp.]|nr:hypothetical protein [Snowella sp.]
MQIPTVQFSSTPSSSERSADFFNANASSTNPVSFNLQIPSQNPTPSPTRLGLNQTVTITGVPLKQNLSAAAEGRLAGFEAQPVPWETDVLPLVGATLLFGGGVWWKRRRAAASQLDLTGQGLEQESGRE